MSFASQSLESHHIADCTSVVCAALGILVCLVLVVFHGKTIQPNESRSGREHYQGNFGVRVVVQGESAEQ